MNRSLSLRARLTVVILTPLLLIALAVGAWAYIDAQRAAAARFDRSLLSTALAISRDTAVTGGDALSEETRDLLRDTSGGAVFYHVYAPDGVFVTGYATPPVPPEQVPSDATQAYYDAVYRGAPVRALRFSQSTSIDQVSGLFTFTVWQQTALRDGFVQRRTEPVFVIIASMIGALALIVWFGVRLGLTPLLELEEAIARRSATDLSPIRRQVPEEAYGIVARFNTLLSELSRTMANKDAIISNAAHQLRNPIAGVQTLAEAVHHARTMETAKERSANLLVAVREAGHLTDTLLTLEKARAPATPV
ncbi:Sensor protein BasS [Rhodobacteraceae bacterium THAF1]|uniref:sensor histidine kinase n=1 Tax=Palleronia sp. THAF1 TaxID=2587842 RepID=UPI000F3C9D09|nr:sensor histidine kinase [Palleronia sp. THAF1]QFU09659.1 Sensor protein BasS [Palleronia sp. THAF1]VDC17438.1 Sensor protein BasS [Rhodobacteraceae bacterium THAF1]